MKRHAPATQRNREPILAVLRRVLPHEGLVLEIASGTGEHAAFFALAMPGVTWQPSDPDPDSLASIAAWQAEVDAPNLLAPLALDVTGAEWPAITPAAMVCINMIHISPIEAAAALFRRAGALLGPSGPLVTYGPYRVGGSHTAPSNEAFDVSLRERNPAWGVRDIGELEFIARTHGLVLEERVAMPANNFTLVWRADGH